jgi:sulfide dehydrogenase cytochrome subunit
MNKIKKIALIATISAIPLTSTAVGFSVAELNATTCFSCHGPDGQPTGSSIVPLSVFPASYVSMALKDIKNGKRKVSIMDRHIKGYTIDELDAIANYIASLNKKK